MAIKANRAEPNDAVCPTQNTKSKSNRTKQTAPLPQQHATTDHGWFSTRSRNEPQRKTTYRNEQQQTATNHNKLQQTATNRNEPQQTETN